jgi:signal transduction histidine kinase
MIRVFDELLHEDRLIKVDQNLSIRPCNPRKLLQDAADAAGIFGTDIQIRVETFFIPEVWNLDEALIRIVLRSLTDNAIKYSPSGGRVVLSGGKRANEIWFEVFNSGPGIDPNDLKHIFEKGFRGKNAGNKPGSGYGLALARNAIEKYGGDLKLESMPGRGTRVRIWLK